MVQDETATGLQLGYKATEIVPRRDFCRCSDCSLTFPFQFHEIVASPEDPMSNFEIVPMESTAGRH